EWLRMVLDAGSTVGVDGNLHTVNELKTLERRLEEDDIRVVAVENPVDRIWNNQPDPPQGAIVDYPVELAGESDAVKRQRMVKELRWNGALAAVFTVPSSICWLLNIRGADIPRSPVVHAFAILHSSGRVELFTERDKMPSSLMAARGDSLDVRAWDELSDAFAQIRGAVQIDPNTVPFSVEQLLTSSGCKIIERPDPCLLAKAVKNDVEIGSSRSIHLEDGAAMAEFLAWVDENATRGITEIDIVRKLEECRLGTGKLRDTSFDAIAACGPNAAHCHYRVTHASNRRLRAGELLLIDSGGNYEEGTTDITRTVPLGSPTSRHGRYFTTVLKGLMALSRARWPIDTWCSSLDAIARYPLWRLGADYDHGTGHGVGHYLDVHEGPQRLTKLSRTLLKPGMIMSIEPGYYEAGQFGIRIENLAVVKTVDEALSAGNHGMLCFETLTFVPIDRRLVRADLLTDDELAWLDSYHAETVEKIRPLCSPPTQRWLEQACAPIRQAGT
ncbi:MAG: aminopeptidase family protein P, partial [Rhodobacteraceae bacterium]|nr:aminopeptidase family protein P [Paracoccaceae bacterium]